MTVHRSLCLLLLSLFTFACSGSTKEAEVGSVVVLSGASASATNGADAATAARVARTPCELATAMRSRAAGHVAAGSYARALRGLDRADVLCLKSTNDGQRLLLEALLKLGAFSRADTLATAIEARNHSPEETASVNAARQVIAGEKARAVPDVDIIKAMRTLRVEGINAYLNKDYASALTSLGKVWDVMRPQGETLHAVAMAELDANKGSMTPEIRLKLDRAMVEMELKGTPVTLDTPDGFGGPVLAAAWSPDGRMLAVAAENETSILDVGTLRETTRLRGHTKLVNALAFSPDSKTLASGSYDGSARTWDLASGSTLRKIDAHKNGVASLAFSRDGKLLFTGPWDGPVRVWQVETGKPLRDLAGTTAGRFLDVSPDGRTIAVGMDKSLGFWDVATGTALRKRFEHGKTISSVSFSPDGKTVATGSLDGVIRLWSLASGAARTLGGDNANALVVFSPDGKTLASSGYSASYTGLVQLWSVETGKPVHAVAAGGTARVESVSFSPDGSIVASSSEDGGVRLVDVATGKPRRTLEPHTRMVFSVSVSPDGKTLAAAGRDPAIRLWGARAASSLRTMAGHAEFVRGISFAPDERVLASGSEDSTVRLWDVTTSKLLRTIDGRVGVPMAGRARVGSVAFSPDGKTVASSSAEHAFQLWSVATGKALLAVDGEQFFGGALAFSPDGKTIAGMGAGMDARLWEVATGKVLHTLEGSVFGIDSLVFAPDGKRVAAGTRDSTILVWEVATGKPAMTLRGHSKGISDVAFSPDGKTIASGSHDRAVRIWDAVTGNSLRTLEGHDKPVFSVAFSPDGTTLASGSEDGSVRLWNAGTGAALLVLRAIVSRPAGYAMTPDSSAIEFLGDEPAAARQYPVCRAGARSFPLPLCAGRFEISGLMSAVLNGDGLDEVL